MVLGIVGAGGSGKLAVDFAHRVDPHHDRWSDIIFIDDVVKRREVYHTPVYRSKEILTDSNLKNNLEVVISLGNPEAREKIFHKMKEAGICLATMIDPQAQISESVQCGEGVVICDAFIGSDTYIGDNTIIYQDAVIGHDVSIGKNTIISAKCFIAGHCTIGDRVFMGPVSVMRDRLFIEDDCVISIGATLFKDMSCKMVAIGNPAKIIKREMEKGLFDK